MAKPKLGTKTPDDPNTNALIDQHADLLNNPNEPILAIVELSVVEELIRPQTGDRTAKVQIVDLEVMHGADRTAADKLMTRVKFDRTGLKSRPAPGEGAPKLGEQLAGIDDTVE